MTVLAFYIFPSALLLLGVGLTARPSTRRYGIVALVAGVLGLAGVIHAVATRMPTIDGTVGAGIEVVAAHVAMFAVCSIGMMFAAAIPPSRRERRGFEVVGPKTP